MGSCCHVQQQLSSCVHSPDRGGCRVLYISHHRHSRQQQPRQSSAAAQHSLFSHLCQHHPQLLSSFPARSQPVLLMTTLPSDRNCQVFPPSSGLASPRRSRWEDHQHPLCVLHQPSIHLRRDVNAPCTAAASLCQELLEARCRYEQAVQRSEFLAQWLRMDLVNCLHSAVLQLLVNSSDLTALPMRRQLRQLQQQLYQPALYSMRMQLMITRNTWESWQRLDQAARQREQQGVGGIAFPLLPVCHPPCDLVPADFMPATPTPASVSYRVITSVPCCLTRRAWRAHTSLSSFERAASRRASRSVLTWKPPAPPNHRRRRQRALQLSHQQRPLARLR